MEQPKVNPQGLVISKPGGPLPLPTKPPTSKSPSKITVIRARGTLKKA